jgi:ribose transport system permease protein
MQGRVLTPAEGSTDPADVPVGLRRAKWRRVSLGLLSLGSFLVLVVAVFGALSPVFLTYSNAGNILSNVAVIGIVSIGQTFTILGGGFDLSVGGIVPLAAVTYSKLANAGLFPPVATLASVAVGAMVGTVNGLIVTKLGINPLIGTLGTLSVTSGLALTITGGVTDTITADGAGFLTERGLAGLQWHVWVFVLAACVVWAVLRYTVFGRSVYAVGGNREASWLAGFKVDSLTIATYLISGSFAALAGVVLASELLAGSGTLGSEATLTSIAAVILGGASLTGGVGSIGGTLTGVLVLGVLGNGMALLQVPAFYQQIATGIVLLIAVGFGRLRDRLEGV